MGSQSVLPGELSVQHEPIAVVGIGCRLPGQVSSPSDLWNLLIENRSSHGKVPKSRFNADGFYHPDGERPGSINSTGGYFVQEDVRSFDNAFFGINNVEALYMDAQQRKLLEVVYESFENGGVPLSRVQGSRTGVYVGNFTSDYMVMQYKDPEYYSRHSATGAVPTVLANRITHCFDLRGPSFVLDTACSSSMYALHLACLGLDAHDCDAAVVASANLVQSTELHLAIVKAGILSPDSVCHTFDESANGYGRADGVSSIYLKRLSDAQRAGDPIRCIIRGTAINGNGHTPGIVQPSIDGQEAVIRAAYMRARLPTDETDYVEAHGTGTKVGDPMELEGISRVFHHKTDIPTAVGGVKPNLGHSEGASGLSSIIKLALALENAVIPATIGVKNINPSIKLDKWNLDIVRENRPWPSSRVPRASISSFGFGGANGHAILEASPVRSAGNHMLKPYHAYSNGSKGTNGVNGTHGTNGTKTINGNGINGANGTNGEVSKHEALNTHPVILTFSARTEHSLNGLVKNMANYVSHVDNHINLKDLAYTLNSRRSRLATRAFAIARPQTIGEDIESGKSTISAESEPLPLAFIFTGQGAQWSGMGSQLFDQYPTFRRSIQNSDSFLASLGATEKSDWSIEEVILAREGSGSVNSTEKSQTVCTAIQVALVDLLKEWNITPKVVIGHSSGEIAAAYAAGHLSNYQAVMAAYFRGRTVAQNARHGAMAVVGLGENAAKALIDDQNLGENIALACDNSPESTTLSGEADAVENLLALLQGKKTFARKLNTDGKAYHSRHMKEIGHLYQQALERVWNIGQHPGSKSESNGDATRKKKESSQVRFISSVSGTESITSDMATPAYWVSNLESPVRFREAVGELFHLGRYHLLELGPHSALELPIKQISMSEKREPGYYAYNSALVRNKDSAVTLLSLVGSLLLRGNDDLLWENILPDDENAKSSGHRVLTDLPHYPWDYTAPMLWTESRAVTEFRNRLYPRHDLLGSQIPGANMLTITWRNIIDMNEITWLKDHRLGPSVVLPAAAYIAMGVEAACQVNKVRLRDCPGVEMRHFNFLKAMDFHAEQRPRLEVFTEMQKAPLNSVLASDTWWKFTVSSVSGEDLRPTVHATGLVSLAKTARVLPRTIGLDKSAMEHQAARVWYDKSSREGLNWGPKFAMMQEVYCDPAKKACNALVATELVRGDQTGDGGYWQYIAHPISMDVMLQTAFVAGTGGSVNKLRAAVPVKVDRISFSAPGLLDMDLKNWAIDAGSTRVGFGTFSIEAELYNAFGDTLVRMEGARLLAYQGNVQREAPEQRNPMCRVVWRPDVMLMDAGVNPGLAGYMDWFAQHLASEVAVPEPLRRLVGALDLCVHKDANARILLLDVDTDTSDVLLKVLKAVSPFRHFETITRGTLADGELHGYEILSTGSENGTTEEPIPKETKFDLVFSPESCPSGVKDWIAESAILVTGRKIQEHAFSESDTSILTETANEPVNITLINKRSQVRKQQKTRVVMVSRNGEKSALDKGLHEAIESYFGCTIPLIGLSEVNDETIPPRSIVVSTIESEETLLTTMNEDEMQLAKTITNRASLIFWVCHASLMAGTNPELSPVLGFARALMLEQPSLRFAVFDVDDTVSNIDGTAHNACKIMDQLMSEPNPELELSQKEQTIHSVRFEPLEELNDQFRLKQDGDTVRVPIAQAGRCRLHIPRPGQLDTIHFEPEEESAEPLPDDYVEVEVKNVGINAKDLYVLTARVDTRGSTCSCECAGVITNVGSKVTDFKPGDRVVAMGPGRFATHERLPQWAVCKLRDDEDFATASTIPIVFSTAIYGLIHRANLQKGESILIHSAAGGAGIAAIQVAKHVGARIFATVGNPSKKEFLVNEFGLDPTHIFNSRDSSFLPAVMKATNGLGVDVVLNSLTGELLQSSFEACADFGRFVEIGKYDILHQGSLNMSTFEKNVSFIAFDLSNLYHSHKDSHHDLWQKLLVKSMELIRNGTAKPCFPIKEFPASEITQAFRHFSLGFRIGKVVVSFQDGADCISVRARMYDSALPPNKSYLMIGCLGGLGRSISKWIVSRGARSLVFLSRSGVSKPEANTLVNDLRKRGVHVTVVNGSVTEYEDVEKAIQQAPFPIGGVIQAAMGLSEALWSSMSHDSWHSSIAPKVKGTWNLHDALEKDDRWKLLDFFILTSSINGTVGTATEGNYCAANAFLDAFARYRNSLGRPAISIGYGMIAEVGYLHEHPDIEALLKRKGIHPITEDEMLQILDLVIVNQAPSTWTPHYDGLAGAHILTGIEFTDLKEQRNRGFEGTSPILADPRTSLLAAAYERSTRGLYRGVGAGAGGQHLPTEVAKLLVQNGPSASTVNAVQEIVANKMSNLILLPAGQLRPEQKLGEFGIDSMLAAEFRTFIFHALEVDVPFMTLLDKHTSVRSLAETIVKELESRQVKNGA
ncbi:polyketide synthase [Hypoxylon sp. FL1284]|nr:polyketide synthase [Hypoxylon sp. FL1284]